MKELQDQLQALRDADSFDVLGLEPGAGTEEVEAAFLKVAGPRHPHRFARHGCAEVTQAATEVFVALGEHRNRCLKPRKRIKPNRKTSMASRAKDGNGERNGLWDRLLGRRSKA